MREQRLHRVFLRGGEREVRAAEQRFSSESCQIIGDARIDRRGNQPLAQNDMRRQKIHDDGGAPGVEKMHMRHKARHMAHLALQGLMLKISALQRQRPTVAHQPHIGQGLLDHEAACGAGDDEHEVEVAIAHLAHLPGGWSAAQFGGKRRCFADKGADPRVGQRRVAGAANPDGGGMRTHAVSAARTCADRARR